MSFLCIFLDHCGEYFLIIVVSIFHNFCDYFLIIAVCIFSSFWLVFLDHSGEYLFIIVLTIPLIPSF